MGRVCAESAVEAGPWDFLTRMMDPGGGTSSSSSQVFFSAFLSLEASVAHFFSDFSFRLCLCLFRIWGSLSVVFFRVVLTVCF